jgi:hypothetical protein
MDLFDPVYFTRGHSPTSVIVLVTVTKLNGSVDTRSNDTVCTAPNIKNPDENKF